MVLHDLSNWQWPKAILRRVAVTWCPGHCKLHRIPQPQILLDRPKTRNSWQVSHSFPVYLSILAYYYWLSFKWYPITSLLLVMSCYIPFSNHDGWPILKKYPMFLSLWTNDLDLSWPTFFIIAGWPLDLCPRCGQKSSGWYGDGKAARPGVGQFIKKTSTSFVWVKKTLTHPPTFRSHKFILVCMCMSIYTYIYINMSPHPSLHPSCLPSLHACILFSPQPSAYVHITTI